MLLSTILITCFLVALAFILLGIKILILKDGEFPNTHISGNKGLREKGIQCAKSQDREAQNLTIK
ncbi:MAG: hypothetical protein LUG18_12820 [Candidatus Azobacteroides sp.]|nr:hypothetical protein [Candidatus Azobacteroides sp.]